MPRSKVRTAALRLPFAALLLLTLLPGQARGQVVIKVNDDVNFRFGVLLQNLKVTAFFERLDPSVRPAAAKIRITNHAGIQLQFYYF